MRNNAAAAKQARHTNLGCHPELARNFQTSVLRGPYVYANADSVQPTNSIAANVPVTSTARRPPPVRGATRSATTKSNSSASDPAAQIQVFWTIVKTPETLTWGVRLSKTNSRTPPPQQIAAKACASS